MTNKNHTPGGTGGGVFESLEPAVVSLPPALKANPLTAISDAACFPSNHIVDTHMLKTMPVMNADRGQPNSGCFRSATSAIANMKDCIISHARNFLLLRAVFSNLLNTSTRWFSSFSVICLYLDFL